MAQGNEGEGYNCNNLAWDRYSENLVLKANLYNNAVGRRKFFRAGVGLAGRRIKISCPDSNRDWLLFWLSKKVTEENDISISLSQ